MFGIEEAYDKVVDVQRLVKVEGKEQQEYQDNLTNISCHIQPLDEGYTEDLNGVMGKDFLMFCNIADIVENDKVVCESEEYIVVGSNPMSFMDENCHLEIRLRKLL